MTPNMISQQTVERERMLNNRLNWVEKGEPLLPAGGEARKRGPKTHGNISGPVAPGISVQGLLGYNWK
jgi:hypothetical protein